MVILNNLGPVKIFLTGANFLSDQLTRSPQLLFFSGGGLEFSACKYENKDGPCGTYDIGLTVDLH